MPLECAYDADDSGVQEKVPLKTFTTDISRAGLGLLSDSPLREGQLVKIYLRHVFTEPILAEVRWCRPDMDTLYKIGMRYLDFSPMDLSGQG